MEPLLRDIVDTSATAHVFMDCNQCIHPPLDVASTVCLGGERKVDCTTKIVHAASKLLPVIHAVGRRDPCAQECHGGLKVRPSAHTEIKLSVLYLVSWTPGSLQRGGC